MSIPGEMELEEAGRKREGRIETQEASPRKKSAIVKTKWTSSWLIEEMTSSLKEHQERRLKQAVARRNEENPDAEPMVFEALTEQERAALVQEEEERRIRRAQEYSKKAYAELELERAREPPPPPPDPNLDTWDLDYRGYRRHWEMKYAEEFGSFDNTTPIPAMCFTDNPSPLYTHHRITVQIFAVKVAQIAGVLQWPLDVFGTIAVRDGLDHNRNIIFSRTRDNCQTLDEQDPYLVLTGPTRAAVYESYVYFDAVLKVKGSTESEDKDLCLLCRRHRCCESINLCVDEGEAIINSCVNSSRYTSKLSTLELTCGLVVSSVEATIAVRVVEGSWPDGFRGRFTACIASVGHMKVLLLDTGDDKVVAVDGGTIELSRRVVSVERFGALIVCATAACRGGNQLVAAESKVSFAPLEAGRSHGMLDLGFCKMQVTVAWSRLLKYYHRGISLTNGSIGEEGSRSSQVAS